MGFPWFAISCVHNTLHSRRFKLNADKRGGSFTFDACALRCAFFYVNCAGAGIAASAPRRTEVLNHGDRLFHAVTVHLFALHLQFLGLQSCERDRCQSGVLAHPHRLQRACAVASE
jgi:hypothetical protein